MSVASAIGNKGVMPQRVARTAPSVLPKPVIGHEKSSPRASAAWTATARAGVAESPVDRWQRLHAPVLEPVAVKSPISAEARAHARAMGGTPREAQDMMDTLNGFGLAEPMWPHFKSMGFGENEAGMLRESLKRFDDGRRTSIVGVERLTPRAQTASKLSAVVEALIDGRTPDLSKLDATHARLIGRAGDDALTRATALLESELSHFITDSPVDLVDGRTADVKRALVAVIKSETSQLEHGDAAAVRKLKHDGLRSIGLLRELAVLDPREAQRVGSVFAKALHAAPTK